MKTIPSPFKVNCSISPEVKHFFDSDSNTFSYVVKDPASQVCAIIDPVLGFDYASGRTDYKLADEIAEYVVTKNLEVSWIIETHVHADHLSAAQYLKSKVGGLIAIGKHIDKVQAVFGKVFNEGSAFRRDGSQFDQLFNDGDTYRIGNLNGRVLHTPGHTPACTTHLIGNAAFVGDTLFMPDCGTARADFPGGNAGHLYESIQKILSLPAETIIYVCHDYPPNGRSLRHSCTVQEQLKSNIHVNSGITKQEFVALREAKDKTLKMPRLIIPSLQINIKAGNFPEADSSGNRYLKVPLNLM